MTAVKVKSVNWEKVEKLMLEASHPCSEDVVSTSKDIVFPGAVLLIGVGGEVIFNKAFGCRSLKPELTPNHPDMVYDVSSLTKVISTTSLVMHLVQQELLDVDRRLSRIFQTFGTHGKERMTVRDLLTHTSGYPDTVHFFKQIAKANEAVRYGFASSRGATDAVNQEIFRMKLDHLPGKVTKYSDIGFMLLANVIELIAAAPIDKIANKVIFKPLKMHSTGFIDLSAVKRHVLTPVSSTIAPTNYCSWRKRILCGEVQDENAWSMGGIAGHAGLFSTTSDIHLFATEMIECWHGRGSLFSKELVRQFWTVNEKPANGDKTPVNPWALGWDTPSKEGSSSGRYFSSSSVGHLGYTGCSLWIDPERELDVILLSNRVHPTVDNELIRKLRPRLHDAIMESLGFV
jgi:serine-type D-Ala-D-Ala carboxypeptidase